MPNPKLFPMLCLLVMLIQLCLAQRRPNPNDAIDISSTQTLADRRNIGPGFPYRRGETPIFNFDQGDEVFIDTIKPLIKGIYQMVDAVVDQRGNTNRFGEALSACQDCV